MAALKGGEIESFVARPDPGRPVALVFGPDAGLVRERADAIMRASVDDPADPFTTVRIDGDELASDPVRLLDEAHTVPLFGGRRAILVRAGGRNFTEALERLLSGPKPESRVVVEAGDLRRGAPLRALCERSPLAVALPCYADTERDLGRLIEAEMKAAGLSLSADARAALLPLLGGDRLASRSELSKLALYAGAAGRVELDDVLAVIADASALALDDIVDAALAGQPQGVETGFEKARIAGTAPGRILAIALQFVLRLHRARLQVDEGRAVSAVVEAMSPQIHFRRRALVEKALGAWSAAQLSRAIARLADATLETRRTPSLAEAVSRGVLLEMAAAARSAARRK